MLLMLFGCKQETEVEHISKEEQEQEKEEKAVNEYDAVKAEQLSNRYGGFLFENQFALDGYNNFAIRQLAYSYKENENDIVSPLSLYYVMAILSNGAAGTTRQELETVLGMTTEDMNQFLHDLDVMYNGGEQKYYSKANALWFNTNSGLSLKEDYKATISQYYGDAVYEGDFADGKKIVDEANSWSKKQTDGAINDILNEGDITSETAMLILNALVSESEWMMKFEKGETFYEEFNNRDNSKGLVEMMHQTLYGYITDGRSEGFVKHFDNNGTFVAIVPFLGTDVYDYLNLMDFSTLPKYGSNIVYYDNLEEITKDGFTCYLGDEHYTNLSFPKYKYESEYDLKEPLKKFGLKNLFDASLCDFSNLADGPSDLVDLLYLDGAKQKCSIEVDEEKVKVASVTTAYLGLGGDGECYETRQKIYHDVVFDRPFIYAIMTPDYAHDPVPMFIGVVTKLGEPIEKAFQIQNITGKINIRSLPSTSGEKLGTYEKGKIIYAFETKEAEGYTWYRIGTDKWVADKNKEWIKTLDAQ